MESMDGAGTGKSQDGDNEAGGPTAVTPAVDLRREHWVLNRVLLVYEETARRLDLAPGELAPEIVADAATLGQP